MITMDNPMTTNLLPIVLTVPRIKIAMQLAEGSWFKLTTEGYVSKDGSVILATNKPPYNGMLLQHNAGANPERVQQWTDYVRDIFGIRDELPAVPEDTPAAPEASEPEEPPSGDLTTMVKELQAALDLKDDLAAQTKENNKRIEEIKARTAQQMVDDDVPQISYGGYVFSLEEATIYNKRSEAELAEVAKAGGPSFFDALRDEGLGYIITETVNSRTLNSTIREYVEENGELSDNLAAVIKPYETTDVKRRKATKKKGARK
jgi:hypothetical protein